MGIFNKKTKLGEEKISIKYNGNKIAINNQTYSCNSINDCYIDGEIVDIIEIKGDYDYVKGDHYELATDDDMSYLLAYDDIETNDIDIYELYLVLELNNGQTKRFLAGRFDENQLPKYESKIERMADKLTDYIDECE